MSKLVRISDQSNKYLSELALQTGKTKQKILESALDLFAREMFLTKANKEYEQLADNQKKELLEENSLLDCIRSF